MEGPEIVPPGRSACGRNAWRMRQPPCQTVSIVSAPPGPNASGNSAVSRRVSSSAVSTAGFVASIGYSLTLAPTLPGPLPQRRRCDIYVG